MNIDDLTIKQAREIAALFPPLPTIQTGQCPYVIGANYFLRTVTHHHTGRLVAVTTQELVLEDAAWIADDGRFTEALATANFGEVEMFPAGRRVIIGRGAIIDAAEITTIPKSQK